MNNNISITHFSNAHNSWLRGLDFYKQELGILTEQLTEIAKKNTGEEAMKGVEHYQNQFRLQVLNISSLSHDIKQNLAHASKEAHAPNAGYIENSLVSQHNDLGQKYETEEKIINELRHSFQKFAAEWM